MENKKSKFWAEVWDFAKTIIITVICALLFTKFVASPVEVDGSSMYPTLVDGQRAFSGILTRKINGIKRFQIVTAYLEARDELIVKRVIGLPGETLEIRDDVLYINGEPVEQAFLNEDYMRQDMQAYGRDYFTADFGPITLGEDEYFIMGDNRPHSADARVFGPFKESDIKTTGLFVFWPFSDFGNK